MTPSPTKLERTSIPRDKWFTFISQNSPFAIGFSLSDGDCFFDSVAQAMAEEKFAIPGEHLSPGHKKLRILCDSYIKSQSAKSSWIQEQMDADAKLGGQDYTTCLMQIQFTQVEAEKNHKSGLFYGLCTWGRPHIEGRIICCALRDIYDLELTIHFLEFSLLIDEHEKEEMVTTHSLVTSSGLRCISADEVDYSSNQVIHIMNYKNHYVPLLKFPHPEPTLMKSSSNLCFFGCDKLAAVISSTALAGVILNAGYQSIQANYLICTLPTICTGAIIGASAGLLLFCLYLLITQPDAGERRDCYGKTYP